MINAFVSCIYREGSVIADFALNFQQTGNATVLPTARKVLNESVTQPQNTSSLADLKVDPASVVIEGRDHISLQIKKVCCNHPCMQTVRLRNISII